MDVIGHEAIADNADAGPRGVAAEEVQIEAAIVGEKKICSRLLPRCVM